MKWDTWKLGIGFTTWALLHLVPDFLFANQSITDKSHQPTSQKPLQTHARGVVGARGEGGVSRPAVDRDIDNRIDNQIDNRDNLNNPNDWVDPYGGEVVVPQTVVVPQNTNTTVPIVVQPEGNPRPSIDQPVQQPTAIPGSPVAPGSPANNNPGTFKKVPDNIDVPQTRGKPDTKITD